MVLQTIASKRWELQSFDIRTAFLRGQADPGNPLAMEPPPELRKMLGLQANEVCELVGNAYGRVDAPLLFYKELKTQLSQLGFRPHPLDPCIFLLESMSQGRRTLHGVLGMHVDDGICGGDSWFSTQINKLQKSLPFGSHKKTSFVFTGIALEQHLDFSIEAQQMSYIQDIMPTEIPRHRRSNPESPLSESEKSQLRAIIGSLQYAVTHTSPDLAARLSEVQMQMASPTISSLLLANRVLKEGKETAEASITYQSIPFKDVTFVSFGDASFASSKNPHSHQGVVIGATSVDLHNNLEAPLSPLVWVSKRISRVVRSTWSAEAYAMSKSVDLLGWVRALWGCIHIDKFPWEDPPKAYQTLNPALIITDCKSLYDLVTRAALPSCEEHRTTLEVLLIRQRCQEHCKFRWIPTTLMLADSLTKSMSSDLIRRVMQLGRFKLHDSNSQLDRAAHRKQAIAWLSDPPTGHEF